jgi:hypothetical protein
MPLRSPLLVLFFGCALGAVACGGSSQATSQAFGDKGTTAKSKATRNPDGSINDGSRCEWKNRPDREASETAGVGFLQPNVRRVFAVVGTGEDRHKVLICREADTNFDGLKDDFRWYSEKGEATREEADTNYDGKIDTWLTFSKGRLAEERIDHNHDGNADEWKYYSEGKLTRAKRDTNYDGRADIWEIYQNGSLERMGVDVDGDEHVDRWDHDNELRRRLEAQDRQKEDAEAAAAKKAAAEKEAADKANDSVESPAPADSSKATGKKPGDSKKPK